MTRQEFLAAEQFAVRMLRQQWHDMQWRVGARICLFVARKAHAACDRRELICDRIDLPPGQLARKCCSDFFQLTADCFRPQLVLCKCFVGQPRLRKGVTENKEEGT